MKSEERRAKLRKRISNFRSSCLVLGVLILSTYHLINFPCVWAGGLSKTALWFPNGHKISVELALTPEDQEKGLMFRESLPKEYGMLFPFPKEQVVQFWMKNTWVDLDILFIRSDKTISKTFHRVPRSYPDTPEEKVARVYGLARYVLELPAGTARRHKVMIGQKLKF
ncbi:MAG: DUF192 domain-containing protein [Elusimicrobia bacterium]|nr:DUF192 domain-containing protein [Elusimicrobiota bacterium]